VISSVEYRPSTIAVASILVARGREETPAGSLDALKAILGSSCPQLDTVSPFPPVPPPTVAVRRLFSQRRCNCNPFGGKRAQ
jgi:hypothetical protein